MRLLLVSDLHRDHEAARSVVARSAEADVVVIAGDLAIKRGGLQEIVDVLAAIETPTVLVCGNGESPEELREACARAASPGAGTRWRTAHVLHGESVEIDGVTFFGLGAAVPVTPFGDWSYDLTEEEAAALLADCPPGAVLVSHSPPQGHVDTDGSGGHRGSWSVLETIERTAPKLVVCGHIHACWGERSSVGDTQIVNAGPAGVLWILDDDAG
ncbi:MAG: metallophosphoesterase family protein [Gemmatimonadota bacterium]|nr:metallophosphoesterase family protein [Gemmatimonadota bacterium]